MKTGREAALQSKQYILSVNSVTVGRIDDVDRRRARLVWGIREMGMTVRGGLLYAVSVYVTSHSSQLGLFPSTGREMSTGQQTAAVYCGLEGNRRSGVTPGYLRAQ